MHCVTIILAACLAVSCHAFNLPDDWLWELHNSSDTVFYPSADQVLLPTIVYRSRYSDYVVVGGYRDELPPNGNALMSTQVWRLNSQQDALYDLWTPVLILNPGVLPNGRALNPGVYDPVGDRILMYGGCNCLPPYTVNKTLVTPPCNLDVNSPLAPFHNTTLVLQFVNASAAVWQIWGPSLQQDMTSYPPPLGYNVGTYDSDTHALVVFGVWTAPGPLNPNLPMYRLDLNTQQWSVIPINNCGNMPDPGVIDDMYAFIYNPSARNYVLYLPSRRQVLVYDSGAQCWEAPIDAQVTAPDYRQHVAFTYVPDINSLLIHGGYFVSTVRENVFTLSLDTWLWDLPVSAQTNAPSRHKHSATWDPDNARVVFWGGMRHDTSDQIYPTETYFLDLPQVDIPVIPFLIPSMIFARNVVAASFGGVAAVVLGLLAYTMICRRGDETRISCVVVPLLGLGDVCAHIVLALACYGTGLNIAFYVCVGLMGFAVLVNFTLLLRHLELVRPTSRSKDKKYMEYAREHFLVFWLLNVAACFHFSVIQLSYSRFLGIRALSATMRMNDIYRDAMSDYMRRRGAYTAAFQDLPMLALQTYLALFAVNAESQVKFTVLGTWLVTLPAFLVSCMSAVYGVYSQIYGAEWYWAPLQDELKILPSAPLLTSPESDEVDPATRANIQAAQKRKKNLLGLQGKYGVSAAGDDDHEDNGDARGRGGAARKGVATVADAAPSGVGAAGAASALAGDSVPPSMLSVVTSGHPRAGTGLSMNSNPKESEVQDVEGASARPATYPSQRSTDSSSGTAPFGSRSMFSRLAAVFTPAPSPPPPASHPSTGGASSSSREAVGMHSAVPAPVAVAVRVTLDSSVVPSTSAIGLPADLASASRESGEDLESQPAPRRPRVASHIELPLAGGSHAAGARGVDALDTSSRSSGGPSVRSGTDASASTRGRTVASGTGASDPRSTLTDDDVLQPHARGPARPGRTRLPAVRRAEVPVTGADDAGEEEPVVPGGMNS